MNRAEHRYGNNDGAAVPWLDVYCLSCRTTRAIDVRTIDRHPGLNRQSRAGPALLVVSRVGAYAGDYRLTRLAAGRQAERIDRVGYGQTKITDTGKHR